MTTYFSILAWEIPWTEEPDRLHLVSQGTGHDFATKLKHTHTHTHTHISHTSDFHNLVYYIWYILLYGMLRLNQ